MMPTWSACCSMPSPGLTRRPRRSSQRPPASITTKILVINKVDLVQREKLLALAQAANERMPFARTFMISAISGDGVDDIRSTLAEMVPPGPFLYPEDQMSDAPMRQLAAEITREKIYPQAAPGIALPVHGRDRQVGGAQGQVGAHRADDLRRAREPAQDRARQGRRHHQVDRRGLAQGDRRDPRMCRCICSCSSRCARTGVTIPIAIARWAWNFPRNKQEKIGIR